MATKDDTEHRAIREKLEEIHEDVKLLVKTIFVGNGKESVMVRLSKVEDEIQDDRASKRATKAIIVATITALGGIVAAGIGLLT